MRRPSRTSWLYSSRIRTARSTWAASPSMARWPSCNSVVTRSADSSSLTFSSRVPNRDSTPPAICTVRRMEDSADNYCSGGLQAEPVLSQCSQPMGSTPPDSERNQYQQRTRSKPEGQQRVAKLPCNTKIADGILLRSKIGVATMFLARQRLRLRRSEEHTSE